jgi:hypothetical protein
MREPACVVASPGPRNRANSHGEGRDSAPTLSSPALAVTPICSSASPSRCFPHRALLLPPRATCFNARLDQTLKETKAPYKGLFYDRGIYEGKQSATILALSPSEAKEDFGEA